MQRHIEIDYCQKPEKFFSMFDPNETGFDRKDRFQRILEKCFSDILEDPNDLKFILKLADATSTGTVNYANFCKFLDKKFVRGFKFGLDDAKKAG